MRKANRHENNPTSIQNRIVYVAREIVRQSIVFLSKNRDKGGSFATHKREEKKQS